MNVNDIVCQGHKTNQLGCKFTQHLLFFRDGQFIAVGRIIVLKKFTRFCNKLSEFKLYETKVAIVSPLKLVEYFVTFCMIFFKLF